MTDYTPYRFTSACGRLELFARDYAGNPGGEAPALLLMHGLTRNSADFEPLVAHLAGRYRLIVPDQRGRGLSGYDTDPANYRPDVYAADMFALLDSLNIESAGLIGTSMGGLMGIIMAAMQPERVQALVLNDIGPELAPEGLARIMGYVGPSAPMANWQAAAERCAAINTDAFPSFTSAEWMDFARRTCRETSGGQVAFAYDPAISAAFKATENAAQPDLWPLWDAVAAVPVLLLRGALSDLLTPQTAQRMGESHSGPFFYAEVPDRGHAPLLDEPAALGAITDFLAEHI